MSLPQKNTTETPTEFLETLRKRFQSDFESLKVPDLKDPHFRNFTLRALKKPAAEPWGASGLPLGNFSEAEIESFLGLESDLKKDYFAQLVRAHFNHFVLFQAEKAEVKKDIRFEISQSSNQLIQLNIFDLKESSAVQMELAYISDAAKSSPLQEKTDRELYVVNRFILARNSSLKLTEIEELDADTRYFVRNEFILNQDSKLDHRLVSVGCARGQIRMEAVCREKGSEFKSKMACSGRSQSLSNFWVSSRHLTSDTQASVELWSVVQDRSKVVFDALIDIPKHSARTEASQLSKSLVLSDRASVEAQPNLKIATDDVKVSHGASMSTIDADQLYYLQSRGIPADEAKQMIVDGFGDPVISEIENEKTREYLKSKWATPEGRAEC